MQTQKMDFKKSYGTVYGHHSAAYEQDSKLYDGGGNLISEEADAPKEVEESEAEEGAAELFLHALLEGGPILQTNIKKESELKELNWQEVLNAAIKMDVVKYKQGLANVWKLNPERA